MNLVKAGFKIVGDVDGGHILQSIEAAGRTCYKSESRTSKESAQRFVAGLLKSGHDSVLEHQSVSVRIVCDRGVSHELVRHRLASYSQESTRYCNYRGGVTFVVPCFLDIDIDPEDDGFYNATGLGRRELCWLTSMKRAEINYLKMLDLGASPQEARAVLPNSTKTEMVMTANLREWRHFFRLRAQGVTGKPHPQMLEIAVPMLREFQRVIPVVFDDIQEEVE